MRGGTSLASIRRRRLALTMFAEAQKLTELSKAVEDEGAIRA